MATGHDKDKYKIIMEKKALKSRIRRKEQKITKLSIKLEGLNYTVQNASASIANKSVGLLTRYENELAKAKEQLFDLNNELATVLKDAEEDEEEEEGEDENDDVVPTNEEREENF